MMDRLGRSSASLCATMAAVMPPPMMTTSDSNRAISVASRRNGPRRLIGSFERATFLAPDFRAIAEIERVAAVEVRAHEIGDEVRARRPRGQSHHPLRTVERGFDHRAPAVKRQRRKRRSAAID